jgi:hypothetical protein
MMEGWNSSNLPNVLQPTIQFFFHLARLHGPPGIELSPMSDLEYGDYSVENDLTAEGHNHQNICQNKQHVD